MAAGACRLPASGRNLACVPVCTAGRNRYGGFDVQPGSGRVGSPGDRQGRRQRGQGERAARQSRQDHGQRGGRCGQRRHGGTGRELRDHASGAEGVGLRHGSQLRRRRLQGSARLAPRRPGGEGGRGPARERSRRRAAGSGRMTTEEIRLVIPAEEDFRPIAHLVTGGLAAREQLIEQYMSLVRSLARRYSYRGEQLEDLVQIGAIGLIKAIDRFDLDRGVELTTYATPNIIGEIKRHFRDKGWSVRVPRGLQELNVQLSRLVEQLTVQLGRSPTITELAKARSEEHTSELQSRPHLV